MNSCNNLRPGMARQGQGRSNMQGMQGREKVPCTMNMQMSSDMPSLAMSYVPMQKWKNLYQPDEGFHNGTIFKDLNLPFTGRRMC